MAALGEQLIDEGLVAADIVAEALRNQVVRGGRIGTNLVENGAIELDPLAQALARQHTLPPVLEEHFSRRDPKLGSLLSDDVAARLHAIPLYLAGANADQIVVACTDPLDTESVYELERLLGVQVIVGVAPELRILYWLERVYGIERINRFRRIGHSGTHDFEREPTDPERRHFVHTLSDAEPPPAPSRLARIAVRKIAVPLSGEIDTPPSTNSLDELVRAIRRSTSRSRIGHLVVHALREGFGGSLDAGVLLVVRDEIALGWKGFVRDRSDDSIEAIAVPLAIPAFCAAPT